jgi:hypothetical protein
MQLRMFDPIFRQVSSRCAGASSDRRGGRAPHAAHDARAPLAAHAGTQQPRRARHRSAGKPDALSVLRHPSCSLSAPSMVHHGAPPFRYTPRQPRSNELPRPRRRHNPPLAAILPARHRSPSPRRPPGGGYNVMSVRTHAGSRRRQRHMRARRRGGSACPPTNRASFGSPPVVTNQCAATD